MGRGAVRVDIRIGARIEVRGVDTFSPYPWQDATTPLLTQNLALPSNMHPTLGSDAKANAKAVIEEQTQLLEKKRKWAQMKVSGLSYGAGVVYRRGLGLTLR